MGYEQTAIINVSAKISFETQCGRDSLASEENPAYSSNDSTM